MDGHRENWDGNNGEANDKEDVKNFEGEETNQGELELPKDDNIDMDSSENGANDDDWDDDKKKEDQNNENSGADREAIALQERLKTNRMAAMKRRRLCLIRDMNNVRTEVAHKKDQLSEAANKEDYWKRKTQALSREVFILTQKKLEIEADLFSLEKRISEQQSLISIFIGHYEC